MKFVILISLLVSVTISVCLLSIVIKHLFECFLKKGALYYNNSSFNLKFIVVAMLLLSVWTLRFAVGLYSVFKPLDGLEPLNLGEAIFNSFVHALRTLSLDEEYELYILAGKRMLRDLFGSDLFASLYGVYAAVLNVAVPVAGGTILFELFSEFSPRFRLFFVKRSSSDKYYFSKLNDRSLALAKNIVETKETKEKIHIIFTDTYMDNKEESISEQFAEAKQYGFICLKDDLRYVPMQNGKTKLFLIDENESSNINALIELVDCISKKTERSSIIKESEIFVFSSDETSTDFEEVIAQVVNQKITKGISQSDIPTIIPVNSVRNMTNNLLIDVPLYEPILYRDWADVSKKKLNVTVVGSRDVGTEFFLTTYWCGQILDCILRINVVSDEHQSSFESRLNKLNPDILKTSVENSEILEFSPGQYSDVYFSYNYIEEDILTNGFANLKNDYDFLNTDYFIVALSDDKKNLEVATQLRKTIATYHIAKMNVVDGKPNRKTVICYLIKNSDLCNALNEKHLFEYIGGANELPDIYMNAFGDIDSVYSVKNVLMDDISESAYALGRTYSMQSKREAEEKRESEKTKRFKDIYSYQANIARRIHRKYKIYSAGFLDPKTSVFFRLGDNNYCDSDYFNSAEKAFRDFVVNTSKNSEVNNYLYKDKEKMQLLHELAWLEHRRWCAYLRTKGFSRPNEELFAKYLNIDNGEHKSGDHKFIDLKLHPCLVECSKEGIKNCKFNERGFLIKESENPIEIEGGDYLDVLSKNRAKIVKDAEDFKHWDYPEFDLGEEEKRS